MKVVYINSFNCGSTGNLMLSVASYIKNKGEEYYFCCPSSRTNKKAHIENQIFIGNRLSRNLHLKLSQITGINGIFSCLSTIAFIRRLNKINPDIIHINNLHNCYINIPLLFRYIKSKNISVVWTIHDCWGFTAYCPYFDIMQCEKWKTGCYQCPQYRKVMSSSPYIDNSSIMWRLKKQWFSDIKIMQIVSPSRWIADRISESFLKGYTNKVIYNGVDLNTFYPRKKNIKKKLGIEKKYMLLGVAAEWGYRKGIDVFIKLSEIMDESYQIVLVGVEERVSNSLHPNIISIARTTNQIQLAEIYSSADVFINPTREEVFGLVNIEALACGTPVITFNSGGSPETIDQKCGYVIAQNNLEQLVDKIHEVCEQHTFSEKDCISRANHFSIESMCEEYYKTYQEINQNN